MVSAMTVIVVDNWRLTLESRCEGKEVVQEFKAKLFGDFSG